MSKLDVGSEQHAAVVSEKLLGMFQELEDLVRVINEQANNEQSRAFRQAIGSVCGSLVVDVLGPLYRAYPQIRPENWPKEE
jgi:DNA-binding transcriptional LysR family regulator